MCLVHGKRGLKMSRGCNIGYVCFHMGDVKLSKMSPGKGRR